MLDPNDHECDRRLRWLPTMGDGGEEGLLDAGLIKDEYVLDYVWSADGLTVAWEPPRPPTASRWTSLFP
jgi:hypothetical protein